MKTEKMILEETKNLSNEEKIQYYNDMFRRTNEKLKVARMQVRREIEEKFKNRNEPR